MIESGCFLTLPEYCSPLRLTAPSDPSRLAGLRAYLPSPNMFLHEVLLRAVSETDNDKDHDLGVGTTIDTSDCTFSVGAVCQPFMSQYCVTRHFVSAQEHAVKAATSCTS